MNDQLGQRMKLYEAPYNHLLPRRTYTIVRVDGRAFHTYLRHAKKPFDSSVADAMGAAAEALCKEMDGARFAYTQSDEISVLLTDFANHTTTPWFNGEVQKIASVAASIATAVFSREFTAPSDAYPFASTSPPEPKYATFDARVYTIPQQVEVANYFVWRQKDAMRNAVSMAARAHFPHKVLLYKSVSAMKQMLVDQCGIHFENYPERFQRGAVITRNTYSEEISVPVRQRNRSVNEGSGQGVERRSLMAVRSRWEAVEAPRFSAEADGFLADRIPAYTDRLMDSEEVRGGRRLIGTSPEELPHPSEDPVV